MSVCVSPVVFIHPSSINGHLGCSNILVVVNNAANEHRAACIFFFFFEIEGREGKREGKKH